MAITKVILDMIQTPASGVLGGANSTVNHSSSFIIGDNITTSAPGTVFVNSLSASALSGVYYGDGSNLTGVIKTQYSLPTASSSVLGGVKTGGNITIDGSGNINAPTYSLPTASSSVLGGVKTGGNITIDGSGNINAPTYSLPTNVVFSSVSALALSGIYYGDGSKLTGIPSSYVLPTNVVFSSVSALALSGIYYGDGSNLAGVIKTQYSLPTASSSVLGGVKTGGNITIDGSGNINAPTYSLPTNVVFSSVSALALSGIYYGDGSNLAGVIKTQYSLPTASSSVLGGVKTGGNITIDGSGNINAPTYSLPTNVVFSSVSALALSGIYYGDGSKLTGIPSSYVLPTNVVFSSVSALALSGVHYGDGSKLTGINATAFSLTGGTVSGVLSIQPVFSSILLTPSPFLTITPQAVTSGIALYNNPASFSTNNLLLGQNLNGAFFGRIGIKENHLGLVDDTFASTIASSASASFVGIAMSSDGKTQVTADYDTGAIYMSYDYGATFSIVGNTSGNAYRVAISSDGKTVIVSAWSTYVKISRDGGATWSAVTTPGSNGLSFCVATNSDGRIMLSGKFNSNSVVSVSYNYGVTWATVTSLGIRIWWDVKMSSDGRIMAAVDASAGGSVYISYDYGVTFAAKFTAGSGSINGIAMSADGRIMTTGTGPGYIYISYDYGLSWTAKVTDTTRTWSYFAMSADGRVQVGTIDAGNVWVSYDYGATWSAKWWTAAWRDVAVSSDGRCISVAVQNSSIFNTRASSVLNGTMLIGYNSSNNSAYKLQVNSQIFATSNTIATSDGRYKQNINSLSGALNWVDKLNPVSFDWKSHPVHNFDKTTSTVGFVAQEVKETFKDTSFVNAIVKSNTCEIPEVLDESGNIINSKREEEFLGIAEGNLIAVLTAAIKELKTKVDVLDLRIAELEASKQS